jgi:cytoskeletal protein CcmA (bactofilin family)
MVTVLSANTALADVPLSGKLGRVTIDDTVEIRRNTSATLNGTVIKGNVLVRSGATLVSNGAKIDGNVQAFDANRVDLGQQTVVHGDVQAEGTRSLIVRGGTFVGGNVQLTEASAAVTEDALRVEFSKVDGDLHAEKSSGRLRALENQIGGNLQFLENKTGTYEIENNSIGGGLQFFKNRGSGGDHRQYRGGQPAEQRKHARACCCRKYRQRGHGNRFFTPTPNSGETGSPHSTALVGGLSIPSRLRISPSPAGGCAPQGFSRAGHALPAAPGPDPALWQQPTHTRPAALMPTKAGLDYPDGPRARCTDQAASAQRKKQFTQRRGVFRAPEVCRGQAISPENPANSGFPAFGSHQPTTARAGRS